jgi:hypothetical protein
MKRTLYAFNWNRKIYWSTRKGVLEAFASWLSGKEITSRVFGISVTNWRIDGVERAPAWVPIPVIEPGIIEYEKT